MTVTEIAKSNSSKWHPAAPAKEEALADLVSKIDFELPPEYLEFYVSVTAAMAIYRFNLGILTVYGLPKS